MAIVFGDAPESTCCRTKCLPIAPEYEEVCCPDPCDPCGEKKCPPKTCASNTIKIQMGEVERCFTFRQMGCKGRPIPAIRSCLRMEIRRKGFCRTLLKILPYRMDVENGVCFKWGDHFLSLPKGYYEGDIYINDECCTHVLLYLPGCQTMVAASEPVIDEGCGGATYASDCCAIPQYDEDIAELTGDCDMGCSKC